MPVIKLARSDARKTMLSAISLEKDAQAYQQNLEAARAGGEVAGSARKDLEKRTGKKVITRKNYLEKTQTKLKQKVKNH